MAVHARLALRDLAPALLPDDLLEQLRGPCDRVGADDADARARSHLPVRPRRSLAVRAHSRASIAVRAACVRGANAARVRRRSERRLARALLARRAPAAHGHTPGSGRGAEANKPDARHRDDGSQNNYHTAI